LALAPLLDAVLAEDRGATAATVDRLLGLRHRYFLADDAENGGKLLAGIQFSKIDDPVLNR